MSRDFQHFLRFSFSVTFWTFITSIVFSDYCRYVNIDWSHGSEGRCWKYI